MKKQMIAVVLLATICLSMTSPMNADAAAFLAAIPAIWAIAGGALVVAAVNDVNNDQQTGQAASTPDASHPGDPHGQLAKGHPATSPDW
jgi:hypothetical protein